MIPDFRFRPVLILAFAILIALASHGIAAPTTEIVHQWAKSAPETNHTELMEASDGKLYGMSYAGGQYGTGLVFRLSKAGDMEVLVQFSGTTGPVWGTNPIGRLCEGTDGWLYGFTLDSIFKVSKSGTLQTLHQFAQPLNYGLDPGFSLGADGYLYCGLSGAITKMSTNGDLQAVANLASLGNSYLVSGILRLTVDPSGNLFGIVPGGGRYQHGALFKYSTSGKLSVLFDEFPDELGNAAGRVVIGNDGNFFFGYPCPFEITREKRIQSFAQSFPMHSGFSQPVLGPDGSAFCLVTTALASGALTLSEFPITGGAKCIYTFPNQFAAGNFNDQPALVQSADGCLYGLAKDDSYNGIIFFRMSADRVVTPIRAFSFDGCSGSSELTACSDGLLHGTTRNLFSPLFPGTDYQVSLSGSFQEASLVSGTTVLWPAGGLLEWTGTFYGCAAADQGQLFAFSGSNEPHILCSFPPAGTVGSIGTGPWGPLVRAQDGFLYGVTLSGGTNNKGTMFKSDLAGNLSSVVHFSGTTGPCLGASPVGGLTQTADGSLWGVTTYGGAKDFGTIYRISAAGNFSTLVQFTGTAGAFPGAYPKGGLVTGTDGNLYGTTSSGGASNGGIFFKIQPDGTYITLAQLSGTFRDPEARLVWHPSGFFVGTANAPGTIFTASPDGAVTLIGSVPGGPYECPTSLTLGADGNLYGSTSSSSLGAVNQLFRVRFGPTLITAPAEKVTSSSAFLSGTVNPNGASTLVHFEWGLDPTLFNSSKTSDVLVGSGTSPIGIQTSVANILTGRTYYYRIVGSNKDNATLQRGDIGSFYTGTPMPTAAAGMADDVFATAATLSGSVTGGYGCSAVFEVVAETGTFGGSGSMEIAAPGSPFTDPTKQALRVIKAGLLPHTAYKFRIRATNPAGTAYSDPVSFVTANRPPRGTDPLATAPRPGYAITAFNTTTNAVDLDGDTVTITGVSYTGSSTVTFTSTDVSYRGGNAPGRETLLVQLSDGHGGTGATTVTVLNGASEYWKEIQFGEQSTNPQVAGDSADPDGDGMCNLLEYVLHANPTVADANEHLLQSSTSGRLALNFEMSVNAGDFFVCIQGSNDLSNPQGWVDLANVYGSSAQIIDPGVQVQSTRGDDSFNPYFYNHAFTDSVSLSGTTPRRFLRLQVRANY